MPTQDAIVSQMRQALQMADPSLDTSIGSPVRSILDAVGEVVAEQTADQYLLNYQYDINSKSGADLDDFVALFGMARYPAKYAVAQVTFTTPVAALSTLSLGQGMQVATATSPSLAFSTIVPATIPQGGTSVTVPVICAVSGAVGNVAANTITSLVSPSMSISNLTNASPATGGADAETDDMLRARFKATVFRNLAGTESMFQAVALDDPAVTQANVLGGAKTYFDQIQIQTINGSHFGVSSVQDCAYYYPDTDYIGSDIIGGSIVPRGQYTISTNYIPNPAAPTIADAGSGSGFASGTVVTYALVANLKFGGSDPAAITLSTDLGVSASHTMAATKDVTITIPSYSSPVTTIDIYRLVSGTFLKIGSVNAGTTTFTDNNITGTTTPPLNNTTGAPIVTVNPSAVSQFTNGTYEFRFNYVPMISRNDPNNQVVNKIDVYANGSRSIEATENVVYSTSLPFNTTGGIDKASAATSMNTSLFQRLDGTNPSAGNYFQPLHYSPILEMATGNQTGSVMNITVGSTTYTENSDFWVVNEIGAFGNGARSRAGLEWKSGGSSPHANPTAGNLLSVDYIYNDVPKAIQHNVDLWRLVTTDVMVHSAVMVYLDVYLAVVLANGGYTLSSVFSNIQTAISNYLTGLTFDGVVQLSAILSVVQQVPGVAACRFLTSADSTAKLYGIGPLNGSAVGSGTTGHFGIQQINASNRQVGTTTLANDITNSQTTITVQSAIGFPTAGNFVIQVGSEQMQVTSGQGTTTWTVTRGYNSTTAAAYSATTTVYSTGSGVVLENFCKSDGSVYRAIDVFLNDDELAALNNVYLSQMSSSVYGGV